MQLPETNIPIVFKNNKLLDKRQKALLKTIKASTLVGDLPLNTDNFKILKEVMDTISIIKPFVSELFIS